MLPATFNKNDITIAVWDISKRMVIADVYEKDIAWATGWAEGELATQYKKEFHRLPHLNIQDPSNSEYYKKGYTPKSVRESLFDFA